MSADLLERAIARHIEREAGQVYRSQVSDVIADAIAFADLTDGSDTLRLDLSSPALAELSARLADAIEPWALGWRARLEEEFPDARLPFDDVEAAVRWIEGAAAEGDPVPENDEERIEAVMADPHIRSFLGIHDPRTTLTISSRTPLLPLPDFRLGYMRHVPPHPGGPLFKLAEEVETVAKRTSLAPWRVLLFVLTSQRPRLPAANITKPTVGGGALPDGSWVRAPSAVQVTFYTPDLTRDDLDSVYRRMKTSVWGVQDNAPLTQLQQTVLKVVREIGKRPPGESWDRYWLRVGRRMEGLTGRTYTTPQGPHRLWKDAQSKIGALTKEKTDG